MAHLVSLSSPSLWLSLLFFFELLLLQKKKQDDLIQRCSKARGFHIKSFGSNIEKEGREGDSERCEKSIDRESEKKGKKKGTAPVAKASVNAGRLGWGEGGGLVGGLYVGVKGSQREKGSEPEKSYKRWKA